MKNKTGIVSISFRKYTREEILAAASDAGLDAIEWGGDVHVPHGDLAIADEVAVKTKEAGLVTAEYGSYYSIGTSDAALFDDVLASARALGTSVIRVWPMMGVYSDTLDNETYENAVADAKRICAMAPDMTIAFECHPRSLTEEYHTALQLLRDVNMPNLKMLWQPNQHRPLEYNLDAIKALLPYIVGVHVFSWKRKERLPLEEGEAQWREYISLLSEKELYYMLEFMHDDNIETLHHTADVLKSWLDN
jgi:sugar phosphate isomerase/epimerase